MGRRQIKLVFQIGTARRNSEFEGEIIRAACRICGGCTTSSKVGWWINNGDQRVSNFAGVPVRETCFELELTCEPHKGNQALQEVSYAITRAAIDLAIEMNWVHVTETQVMGRHFSIAARETRSSDTPAIA